MATIGDVAERAGVSKMTVSRVINNSGYVKKETRARVFEAIEALHYRPNMLARNLATRRSYTVAYVTEDIADPARVTVSKGIEEVCYRCGYTMIVCGMHTQNRIDDYMDVFTDRCIDGVVFDRVGIPEQQLALLEQAGIICVLLDNVTDKPDVPSVKSDDYAGGYMAAEYLVSKGHTSIGYMHGMGAQDQPASNPEDAPLFPVYQARTQGFNDGLRAHGLNPRCRARGSVARDIAVSYAQKTLAHICNMDRPPTAFYCENDTMAMAMAAAMQESGLSMPRDMAVLGHGIMAEPSIMHPHITSITISGQTMGLEAGRILIHGIESRGAAEHIVLKPALVPGETA